MTDADVERLAKELRAAFYGCEPGVEFHPKWRDVARRALELVPEMLREGAK
jgi:hypothetical protein